MNTFFLNLSRSPDESPSFPERGGGVFNASGGYWFFKFSSFFSHSYCKRSFYYKGSKFLKFMGTGAERRGPMEAGNPQAIEEKARGTSL
ncbi:MAG: hypothetical protein IIC64_09755 [SAR324 cluster bacterium]|nr:hypothetical protein [SAR324 cluster bacterium]